MVTESFLALILLLLFLIFVHPVPASPILRLLHTVPPPLSLLLPFDPIFFSLNLFIFFPPDWEEQLPRLSAPVISVCCKTKGGPSRNSQKQSSPDVQMTCILSKPWSVTFYAHLNQQIESLSVSISIFQLLAAAYLNIKGSIATYLSPRTVSWVRNGAFLGSALFSLLHVQQQVKQAHPAAAVKSHVGGPNSLVRKWQLRGHKPR